MRHSHRARFGLFGLVWLVAASAGGAARADAVPPPPSDCPPGAIGETGHNGPYCKPKGCTTDAECTDRLGYDKRPRACVPLAICVEERKESSRSGWSHGTPITRRFAHEACDDDGRCEVGSCEKGNHCAIIADEPPATTAAPTGVPAKGCGGCDAGGADLAAWLAIAAGLALRARTASDARRARPTGSRRWRPETPR